MRLVKLPKKGEAVSTNNTASQQQEEEDIVTSPPSKEAPTPAGSTTGEKITIGGREYLVHERRHLSASPKSGLADAVYPVVIEEGKDGKRTYKAAANGLLYTIKNYGRGDDEVIIKLRESHGRSSRASASNEEPVSHPDLALDDDVLDLLAAYKSLEHKLDPEAWLNNQLRMVLSEEIARLERVRDGLKKLPQDLLSQLAGADPAQWEKIRTMLKG